MEDEPIRESYSFLCSACGHAWHEDYEIRRVHDSHGLIQSAFFLDGQRTTSPLTQGRCPGCASPRVLVTHRTRGRRPRGGAMMEVSP
ncbi:hypothetical protein [Catenulispora pinisilvae]|uniref:hypothetical protein n=1 Tax=Catenulispora pinisilvae TaxID=2705253 RepID=UPI00189157D1|nr:hypothetical protein [Catenulispora pinisilvae]